MAALLSVPSALVHRKFTTPSPLVAATHLPQSQQQQEIMVLIRCGTAVEPVNPERLGRMFTDNHVFDQPPGGTF